MESKDQSQAKNVNIDIKTDNEDPNVAVKSMKLDANTEGRVGLSKDELMKYANQPFWVRLRNILFASFWIIWLSILVAAISYVVRSPGCVLVSAASLANATEPIAGASTNT